MLQCFDFVVTLFCYSFDATGSYHLDRSGKRTLLSEKAKILGNSSKIEIETLLEGGVYSACYPLHDGDSNKEDPNGGKSQRMVISINNDKIEKTNQLES